MSMGHPELVPRADFSIFLGGWFFLGAFTNIIHGRFPEDIHGIGFRHHLIISQENDCHC